MRRRNLTEVSLTFDPTDPDGFHVGMLRLGPAMGAQLTGTTLYEIPPGEALCPYHYEYGEEEWLLVLAGRPTVRTPEGAEQVEPTDVVFFPRGPGGAHQIRNDSDETVRVLMWSNVLLPTATAYPDSGKVGVWTGEDAEDLVVERAHGVGYYHGEV